MECRDSLTPPQTGKTHVVCGEDTISPATSCSGQRCQLRREGHGASVLLRPHEVNRLNRLPVKLLPVSNRDVLLCVFESQVLCICLRNLFYTSDSTSHSTKCFRPQSWCELQSLLAIWQDGVRKATLAAAALRRAEKH